jgi:hypothetical protein
VSVCQEKRRANLRAKEDEMPDEQVKVETSAPPCCGGGDFYGHEPFCDCGHVLAEEATAPIMASVANLLSNLGGTFDRPTASASDLRQLQRAWEHREALRRVGR